MRQFGLIGFPLSHSFSKKYFSDRFEKEGRTDCVYEAYPIATIEALVPLIKDHPALEGLNVTIPYKELVIPYLDMQTEVVQKVKACNCITIRKGRLTGYNTDTIGFKTSLLRQLQPHHNKALILGTGGAAKAVAYVLETLNIEYRFVSSKPSKELLSYPEISSALLSAYTLVVNTTPLGMYPNLNGCPDIPYTALTGRHFLFDLIYNPLQTQFLEKGAAQGAAVQNGMEMLVLQAEESWKIWNDV